MDRDNPIYEERLSSHWTEALFVCLASLFLALAIWRFSASGLELLSTVLFLLFIVFAFYSLNYRVLVIRLTREALSLKFGVFTWTVPIENIADYRHDELPALKKYGGAGIHFMMVEKRYRASFNFLQHPRVVVALKQKSGPVRDISFSTRRPEEVLRLIQSVSS